jgi:2',3'-cyclic-nucleotide 2'-phosphodiesterase (5'-nucleotidase family)
MHSGGGGYARNAALLKQIRAENPGRFCFSTGVIQTLREQEKVDLVVLVLHLGFPQDMQLLAEVPGVDVPLSAHTHHQLEAAVRQALEPFAQELSEVVGETRTPLDRGQNLEHTFSRDPFS